LLSVDVERVGRSPFLANAPRHREWRASGKQEIFSTLKDAADWIRTSAGETRAEVVQQDIAPEESASSSWEALRLYRDSESYVRQGKRDTAIAMLERALAIDPDFALAHMRMADLLNTLRRQEESNQHYQRAIEAAGKRRLAKWEELRLRGIYALDTGDYRTAAGAFTEFRSLYPHEYSAPHYLADILTYHGDLLAALEMEREAAAKAPDSRIPVGGILTLNLLLGRLDEAEAAAGLLRAMGENAIAREHTGSIHFLRGDLAGARAEWELLKQDSNPVRRARGSSMLAALLAETGRYGEATSELTSAIGNDLTAGLEDQAGLKRLAVASLDLRRGDTQGARNHTLEAVRRIRNVEQYRRAGVILARAGFPADAARVVNELGPGWPGPLAEAARRQINGELLLARQDIPRALIEFEAADRIDSRLRPRDYLARAYAQAGDRARASFIYEGLLRQPAWFWRYADCDLPGARATMLLDYAKVLAALHRVEETRAAMTEYYKLRPNADPDLPESATARNLMSSGATAGQGQ
jgi:tetratricopeptide (TPR) repeat protein